MVKACEKQTTHRPFANDSNTKLLKGILQNINATVATSQTMMEFHFDDDLDGLMETAGHIESQVRGLKQMLVIAAERKLILGDELCPAP